MLLHTRHKALNRKAPPVAQKPGRCLGLVRHHLNKGTASGLRHRQNQVVAQMVEIEEIDSQRFTRCLGHLRWKVIHPC